MQMQEISQAIRAHGAHAVYTAAHRHSAGDQSGLPTVGLVPSTMGDVWRAMSAAYAELGDTAQAVDHAQTTAALETL